MFIHSERVELLCCFVLKLLENWKHFEMALNFLVCGFRLFMFYWIRYHTDLEQKCLRKIVKIDTGSCKIPLQ